MGARGSTTFRLATGVLLLLTACSGSGGDDDTATATPPDQTLTAAAPTGTATAEASQTQSPASPQTPTSLQETDAPTPTATNTLQPTPVATFAPSPTSTLTIPTPTSPIILETEPPPPSPTPTETSVVGPDTIGPIPLESGVQVYGLGYGLPTFRVEHDRVFLSGLVGVTSPWTDGQVIGTLPAGACPQAHHVTVGNQNEYITRIDVKSDCQILFTKGDNPRTWVSLDGISFRRQGGSAEAVSLASGFANYDLGWDDPYAQSKDGLVTLGGLLQITNGSWSNGRTIGTLPASAHPAQRHVFRVIQGGTEGRLDVFPDGHLEWQAASDTQPNWLSLSGVTYSTELDTEGAHELPIETGFRVYGLDYQPPYVRQAGDYVVLGGMIATDGDAPFQAEDMIATVPDGLCPSSTRVFSVNQHDQTARVDISPDCTVKVRALQSERSWLSLDGIVYPLESQRAPKRASD